jgi:hypothetical protein
VLFEYPWAFHLKQENAKKEWKNETAIPTCIYLFKDYIAQRSDIAFGLWSFGLLLRVNLLRRYGRFGRTHCSHSEDANFIGCDNAKSCQWTPTFRRA